MAEKPKTPAAKTKGPSAVASQTTQEPEVPRSRFNLVFKILSLFVALGILIAIGFAAGVYLKLVDVEKISRDMNLSQYPVVSRFFPKTNFEPVELEEDLPDTQPILPVNPNPVSPSAGTLMPVLTPATPNIITKEELEKQAKIKQQEETKRISKLARLYGGMKPEAAVAIMKELDDTTVISIFGKMEEEQVSKILASFDASRAARITQDMLRVQPPVPRL